MKRLLRIGTVLLVTLLLAGCTSPFAREGPLAFVGLKLTRNIIGVPEIGVTVTSVSTKPVKAFTIKAQCWDAYGRLLKEFGFGDTVFSGISQTTIQPGQTRTAWWTLYGYDAAYEVEVALTSAISADNEKWTVGGIWVDDPRYIKRVSFR